MDFTTFIEKLFENNDSIIARDLKLNLKKLMEGSALSAEEAHLALLATATSLDFRPLSEYARESLEKMDFSKEKITEAAESAALMGMLNTYYRFRHMVGTAVAETYKNAGLRMTALAKPELGKEWFEMLALAVSILNGCETCIAAHEKTLREAGVATEKIHDLARLASVVKAVSIINRI
jgi:lipoyl-dependent peroxiredoxin subunit D